MVFRPFRRADRPFLGLSYTKRKRYVYKVDAHQQTACLLRLREATAGGELGRRRTP